MPKVEPLTSIFVNFWTFGSSVGPQFRTLFEKIDPLRPLRPKCYIKNDPRLILYPSAFHQNLAISLSFTNQIQLCFKISVFHFKPFQASFSLTRCSARILPNCSWKIQTEPCQSDMCWHMCQHMCQHLCQHMCWHPLRVPGAPPHVKGSHLPRLCTKSSLREFARLWRLWRLWR